MEFCENCKYYNPGKLTEADKQHLKVLELYDERYQMMQEKSDRSTRLKFTQLRIQLSTEIDRIKRIPNWGTCWRFPKHIETDINHYCGEFTQLYK